MVMVLIFGCHVLILLESCLDIVWNFGWYVVDLGLIMCGYRVDLQRVWGVFGGGVLSIVGLSCVEHGLFVFVCGRYLLDVWLVWCW